MSKHDKLLEELLDAAEKKGVTPEQCGAMLHDATMPVSPPGWSDEDRQRWTRDRETVSNARRKLKDLIGATKLLILLKLEGR